MLLGEEIITIDLHYLVWTNDSTRYIARQAKTDETKLLYGERCSPALIGGRALGNANMSSYWQAKRLFQTASAIVDEVEGRATPYQIHTLNVITNDLTYAVEAE